MVAKVKHTMKNKTMKHKKGGKKHGKTMKKRGKKKTMKGGFVGILKEALVPLLFTASVVKKGKSKSKSRSRK